MFLFSVVLFFSFARNRIEGEKLYMWKSEQAQRGQRLAKASGNKMMSNSRVATSINRYL
jgi:hypothetical protein